MPLADGNFGIIEVAGAGDGIHSGNRRWCEHRFSNRRSLLGFHPSLPVVLQSLFEITGSGTGKGTGSAPGTRSIFESAVPVPVW